MALSNLDFEGVYDKTKRFMIHNWSPEDFSQAFGAESAYNDNRLIETQAAYVITVKAGELREMNQFNAHIFTKNFVTREMLRDVVKLVGKDRERVEMSVNNPTLRDSFEKKTLSEITPGQESPFMDKLREDIRKEEIAKLKAEAKTEIAPKQEVKPKKGNVKEFADA